jgi:hypothetical protein
MASLLSKLGKQKHNVTYSPHAKKLLEFVADPFILTLISCQAVFQPKITYIYLILKLAKVWIERLWSTGPISSLS